MNAIDDDPTGNADLTELITEESVVTKVQELMETLDSIKRYNAFASSFKKFTIIIMGFMAFFTIIMGIISFTILSHPLIAPYFL